MTKEEGRGKTFRSIRFGEISCNQWRLITIVATHVVEAINKLAHNAHVGKEGIEIAVVTIDGMHGQGVLNQNVEE